MNSKQYTKVDTSVETSIIFFLRKIKRIVEKIESGSMTFHYGGRPVRAQKADIVRVISQTNPENFSVCGVRNIILESILTAESFAAGAGFLVCKSLLNDSIDDNLSKSHRVDRSTMSGVIKNYVGMGITGKAIQTIIHEGSIDSEINLSCSDYAFFPTIKTTSAFSIKGGLSEMFQTKRRTLENCGLIFYDGVIERVSEIDHFLQSAFSSKKNIAIFARGYGPEVSLTLSENHSKGQMHVFPIVMREEKDWSKVENQENYFGLENVHVFKTFSSNDIDYDQDVVLKNVSVEVTGIDSSSRRANIVMPSHYKNLMGLLEDRFKLGMKLSKEAALSGCVYDSKGNVYTQKAWKVSQKVSLSVNNSLSSLGCLVLQER